MAQMKHRDARVLQFYRHLRSAIDILELIALEPYQPPEPVVTPTPAPPPEVPREKLTFTLKEAAQALGVSKSTLYKALAEGKLSAIKLGNRTLIPADALRAWLAAMPTRRGRRRS
jgi:excisionase family DNA binding protein